MASAWKSQAKQKTAPKEEPAKQPEEPKEKTPLREPPPEIEAYYESGKGCFWTKNGKDQWQKFGSDEMTCYLKTKGYLSKPIDGRPYSEVEDYLHRVRFHLAVDWAGELAGWDAGRHKIGNRDILITRSRVPVEPAKGDFPLILSFFETLLGKNQYLTFKGWLKGRLEALRQGYPFRPGQLVAFCGLDDCGKSFAQRLITDILGGRAGDPTQYLVGETSFTDDFLKAEHNSVEDKALKDFSHAKRRHFAANLKTMVVNEDHRVHAKGKGAELLPVCISTTISCNDAPEAMAILPALDRDVAQKVIYFLCAEGELPMRNNRKMERIEQLSLFRREIPALIHYLERWQIPNSVVDPGNRFHVRAFHHPTIVGALSKLTPSERLLNLLEVIELPWDLDDAYKGTAAQVESAIRRRDPHGLLDRILNYTTPLGVLLAGIAKQEGEERIRIIAEKGKSHVYAIYKNEF